MSKKKNAGQAFVLAVVLITIISLGEWICWNAVAPTYFAFLPKPWHHIPYWDVWALNFVWRSLTIVARQDYGRDEI